MGLHELSSRAIIGKFFARLEAYIGQGWIDKTSRLFNDSDQESETYKWLGQVPAMREWIGGRQAKGLRANGLTIVNKKFESTIDLAVDWIRRDKTKQIDIRISELALRAAEHWSKLLSTFILNGTGSTSGLCYDGQYFFDDDHSEGDSGSQKNLLATGDVATLDVTTATAPTATEVTKAVLGVIAYMLNCQDDQGEPMNANAKNFLVMTSPALAGPFWAGLFDKVINSGETNTIVSMRDVDGFNIGLAINPRLTYTTQFVIFRTDALGSALIRQEEMPTKLKVLGEGSDYEFHNDAHQYGVKAIHNVGYGYWQYAAHATFS